MRASQPPAPFMALMTAIRAPIITRPSVKPARGELTIGTITFQKMPSFCVQCSAWRAQMSTSKLLPDAASAAPTRPPIRAWLEDEGSPNHQVIRFQTMPPLSAQIISWELTSTTSASIRPEEMVSATAVPISAPIRFITAASATACMGESTLVATTVAMELAVSWKPLMYSKTSATNTTNSTRPRATVMDQAFLSTMW